MSTNKEFERFAKPDDDFGADHILCECLLGDFSPSMDTRGFEKGSTKRGLLQDAVRAYLEVKLAMRPDDFVALAGFHHEGVLVCPFAHVEEDYEQLARALEDFGKFTGNNTRLDLGLQVARDLVFRGGCGDHLGDIPLVYRVLAYSDGYSERADAAASCAEELKRFGVIIHTFGIGKNRNEVDEKLLRTVASTINGVNLYRFLGDGAEIRKTFEDLAQGMLTI